MKKRIISLTLACLMALSVLVIGYASEVGEKESNNKPAEATVFTLDDSITGDLSDSSDVDYFKFDLSEDVIGNFVLDHSVISNKGKVFKVEILDVSEKIEEEFYSVGDVGKATSPIFNLTKGVHYVKVSKGTNWFELKYSISFEKSKLDVGVEKEKNDTITTANEIIITESGQSKDYLGSITSGDIDWYKFKSSKGYFNIQFTNDSAQSFKVKAYVVKGSDSAKNQIFELDVDSSNTEQINSESVGVAKDTVYISVEGSNGSIGGYTISVSMTEDDETEAEYNNTITCADVLPFDKKIYASISYPADVDMFKVTTAKETRNYELKLEPSSTAKKTTCSWNVSLLNSEGSTVEDFSLTNANTVTIKMYNYEVGTYYVKVSAGSDYKNAEYTISSARNASVSTATDAPSTGSDSVLKQIWTKFKQWWANNNFTDLLRNVSPMVFVNILKEIIVVFGQYFSNL